MRRSDRAACIQGGVRSGPAGDRSGHVLVREQTEGIAAGTGRGRALRRRPGGRPRDPHRDRVPGPSRRYARGPRDRRAGGRRLRRARLQRRAGGPAASAAIHARGARARERDRAARRALAPPDRDRGRSRRGQRPGRAGQRGRHRRTDAAGARLPGAAVAEDAGACVGGRFGSGRGGRHGADLGPPDAGVRGRRARDLRPRRAFEQRPPAPGVVERLAPRRASDCSGPWPNSIRDEVGGSAGGSGVLGQFARLSFPIGIGAQGVLLEEGYDAVRISGSGELPPDGDGPVEAIDEDRLGMLGRATLRTLTALDQGPRPEHGPESYVLAVSQVLPGWVISLLAGTLLLPVLVASVDAFARARRRQVDVLRWLRWVAAWVAPFLAALALAQFLALVGATPAPPPAPVRAKRAAPGWCSARCARGSARRHGACALPRPLARGQAGRRAARAGRARGGRGAGPCDRGRLAAALARESVRRAARRSRRLICGCSPSSRVPRRRVACGRS